MKRLTFAGALTLASALGGTAALADSGNNELTCRFELGKGKSCFASLAQCPTESFDACKAGFLVKCNGLKVFFEDQPVIQINSFDDGKIGQTLLGDENAGFAHLAIDASIDHEFHDVYANLYLTQFERIAGKCSFSNGSNNEEVE